MDSSDFLAPEPVSLNLTNSLASVVNNVQTSPQKPPGQSKPNFIWSLHWKGNESLYKWSRSHNQEMATTPIYCETWHGALFTRALQSLYKWWHWVDIDMFYENFKFDKISFCTYIRPRYQEWASLVFLESYEPLGKDVTVILSLIFRHPVLLL